MASLLLSSLCFTSQKPCSFTSSLRFSFGAPTGSRFAAPIRIGFRPVKKRNGRIRVSVYSRASPLVFRDLDADDFRHPLDKQNTLILKAVPGLNELGRALLGSVTEQIMLLENIGTSVLVSKDQLPELHKMMIEAAGILNIEPPDLYVRQSPVPNAYTLAISGKKPFVVIHTSLVELLTRNELQAVLAHELGHLKCDHGVWLTFANLLTVGAYTIPGLGGFIAQTLEEQLFRWLRAAELTCDRAALLVAQDPKVVISVLMKLAGGCPSMADQLSVDAFLEQARSYDKASSSPIGYYIRNAQTRQLSHPLPVLRAREIDEWSRTLVWNWRKSKFKASFDRQITARTQKMEEAFAKSICSSEIVITYASYSKGTGILFSTGLTSDWHWKTRFLLTAEARVLTIALPCLLPVILLGREDSLIVWS
ncbi:hypothetical protein V6N11_023120 [Hibiscus sabdariffa]|uniref:Peptidase M48 domain-containing protein n=1 Tax=Hibiscus sabdariffa TaxID=183260 RepID=A0ABR2TL69_9ROSI